MDRIKILISSLILILINPIISVSASPFSVPTGSPVGYWKTIDDVTGKPKSIIHIWKTEDQALMGKVIKIFPKAGESQNKLCSECQGDRHNQPIVGMVIMSGLKPKQNQWGSGEILDPENGKTYSCAVRLADNGKKLNVHGYIGVPLFGRSQTWVRVDLLSDNDKYAG